MPVYVALGGALLAAVYEAPAFLTAVESARPVSDELTNNDNDA